VQQLIYAVLWIAAIGLSGIALNNVLRLSQRVRDRADGVVALIFGVMTIGLPIFAFLMFRISSGIGWFWPLVGLSTVGLACLSLTAAKGWPLTTVS
jgi:hypothetical protein